jgi:hypothetical protein
VFRFFAQDRTLPHSSTYRRTFLLAFVMFVSRYFDERYKAMRFPLFWDHGLHHTREIFCDTPTSEIAPICIHFSSPTFDSSVVGAIAVESRRFANGPSRIVSVRIPVVVEDTQQLTGLIECVKVTLVLRENQTLFRGAITIGRQQDIFVHPTTQNFTQIAIIKIQNKRNV